MRRHEPRQSRDRPAPQPGTITAVEPQTHDPERVNLFIDGAFALGLPAIVAASEGLRPGTALTADALVRLSVLDDAAKAVAAGLDLLARRPRSEREIRDRLKRRGFHPDAIESAVDKLCGWNYLDDDAFARYWVDNREANKPRGRRLLAQELRQKGVDRETIRQTLDAAPIDEAAAALALAETKLRAYRNLDPQIARRRMAAYLTRRGYSYDVIKPTLARLFRAQDDAALDEEGNE